MLDILALKNEQGPVKVVVITVDSMFALFVSVSVRNARLCPTAYISLQRLW
jgi:hypothetical protein